MKVRLTSSLALCFIMVATLAYATTVAVYSEKNRLILAADSKYGVYSPKTQAGGCKIKRQGDVFYATVGVIQDAKSGFYAARIASKSMSQPGTLLQRTRDFERSIVDPFGAAAKRIKKAAPTVYQQEFIQKPEPLQAVFASIEKDVPTFIVVILKVRDDMNGITITPSHTACPGDACPGNILGENEVARAAAARPTFWSNNLEADLGRLVELEIAAKPDRVGPPVVILRLSKISGPEWVRPSRDCSMARSFTKRKKDLRQPPR